MNLSRFIHVKGSLNLTWLYIALLAYINTYSQVPHQNLAHALYGFNHIQDSTKTKVWWFHGETETTKEGITADLEAFKRAGVGGVIYYDQSHGKAEKALPGFSKEWWEMIRFAASEAQRLALSFELHLSNGYVAGGPWINNENSMKRLTATETTVKGGSMITQKLEAPISKENFYRDVAVLAFPITKGIGKTAATEHPKITSSRNDINLENLFNPRASALVRIAPGKEDVYINWEFTTAFEARYLSYQVLPKGKATTSATNVPGPPGPVFTGTGYRVLPPIGQLEYSLDGKNYRKVCDILPIYRAHESWRQKTVSFNKVKAKYYRLHLHHWWEQGDKNPDLQLGAVTLGTTAKLDQWEEKAGLFAEYINEDKTPAYNNAEVINPKAILNITGKMDSTGLLHWQAPAGEWRVMRFAYIPTGAAIKHGRKNLMGKECDKLSVRAAEIQWNNYVQKIVDSINATASRTVSGVAMDSHEAGAQNWTDNFITEFKKRRGYDPTIYLPAMQGYVVGSVKESDGFLFDVRRNIADMMADNYYGTFERLSSKNGLTFTAQAIGNALCIVGDPILAKSKVSKPQGEFWVIHPDGNYDIKESSSAAHLYGKRIASAEAFTDAKYNTTLAELKSLADYAYAFGINEFVICASAYQPWLNKIPGSTGGGRQYAINRNNTWWNYSTPFWNYQARNAWLMRTGKPQAELCVYLGENAPVKILTNRLPDIPGGYDFDAFTTDALITRMKTQNGKIILPDGVNYQMMVLPESGEISYDALQKIAAIIKAGGKVFGPRPTGSHSKKDAGKTAAYQQLVNEIWGNTPQKAGQNNYGQGTIYWGRSLAEALQLANISPAITMQHSNTKAARMYFAHRKLTNANIFFLHNHKAQPEANSFRFAAQGKHAQLWNAVTGARFSLPITTRDTAGVTIPLQFAPGESYSVIITDHEEALLPAPWLNTPQNTTFLNNDWEVYFDKNAGGPGLVKFAQLSDWTSHSDTSIKCYSGTAVYRKTFQVKNAGATTWLELEHPGCVSSVRINGADAGIVWCAPWQLNISGLLKPGQNEMEIKVANSLMNRMIYDAQLPESRRVTYAYPSIVSGADAPESSGLKQVKIINR